MEIQDKIKKRLRRYNRKRDLLDALINELNDLLIEEPIEKEVQFDADHNVCPDCGKPKWRTSKRCRKCHSKNRYGNVSVRR
jgi:hypothetical protein